MYYTDGTITNHDLPITGHARCFRHEALPRVAGSLLFHSTHGRPRLPPLKQNHPQGHQARQPSLGHRGNLEGQLKDEITCLIGLF